jgi:hypothetical protein
MGIPENSLSIGNAGVFWLPEGLWAQDLKRIKNENQVKKALLYGKI